MKVLCCFDLSFGKLNEKANTEWVGFLGIANNYLIFQ